MSAQSPSPPLKNPRQPPDRVDFC